MPSPRDGVVSTAQQSTQAPSLQDLRSNGLPLNEGGENHMSKQIANQGSSKPNPGDVQDAENKQAWQTQARPQQPSRPRSRRTCRLGTRSRIRLGARASLRSRCRVPQRFDAAIVL